MADKDKELAEAWLSAAEEEKRLEEELRRLRGQLDTVSSRERRHFNEVKKAFQLPPVGDRPQVRPARTLVFYKRGKLLEVTLSHLGPEEQVLEDGNGILEILNPPQACE